MFTGPEAKPSCTHSRTRARTFPGRPAASVAGSGCRLPPLPQEIRVATTAQSVRRRPHPDPQESTIGDDGRWLVHSSPLPEQRWLAVPGTSTPPTASPRAHRRTQALSNDLGKNRRKNWRAMKERRCPRGRCARERVGRGAGGDTRADVAEELVVRTVRPPKRRLTRDLGLRSKAHQSTS